MESDGSRKVNTNHDGIEAFGAANCVRTAADIEQFLTISTPEYPRSDHLMLIQYP